MNINLAKVLTLAALILASTAYAQEDNSSEVSGSSVNKYGTAGCGLGSMIFNDKPGAIQLFAATTNDIAFQTFAITSGTSNCKIGRYEAMQFIDVNRVALAKDVVHGNGETLDSFAKLIGCPSVDLGPELKKNYKSIFDDAKTSIESGTAVIDLIRTQPKLQACSAVTLG